MTTALDNLPVKKRLRVGAGGDVVLVDSKDLSLLQNAKKLDAERNIFLLNNKNEIVWQIQEGIKSHGVVGYSNIYWGKNKELLAYGFNGVEYNIDSATGRILGKELIR